MANSDLILAPGENSVTGQKFSPSIVLAWLKLQVAVTNRRVVWKAPNTILGVIPAGYAENSMPIGAVSAVSVATKFHVGRGVFGAIFIVLALGFIGDQAALGIFLLLLGIVMFLNSATADMTITNHGGGQQSFGVSILEKAKLEHYRNSVNETLYSGGAGGGYGAPPPTGGYGAVPPFQQPGYGMQPPSQGPGQV